ncbi:MAG: aldo/keto reductase [Acidobacteriota bacterium]|nr:aldo/keto reductase [Acidobacteriota bacterium]
MRYRKLGRTGFEVSEIGHGLWGMGEWSGGDDRDSAAALQRSVDLGCNFFDTAWAYADGKSDRMLGELLRRNAGKRLYAASKVPPKNGKWPGTARDAYTNVFPAAHVLAHVDLIRRALDRDTIDLLQFHVWDDSWSTHPEFRETVERLKASGAIRAFGLSLNRWEATNGLVAIRSGLVDAVQVIYNIFDQAPEDDLFPLCEQMDVGVIARVPFDEGSLTGTLTLTTRFPSEDWRSKYFSAENLRPTVERVARLKQVLPSAMALPEMALRFILTSPTVSTVIPGMRSTRHVESNLAASEHGPLASELVARLRGHRWDRTPQPWSD